MKRKAKPITITLQPGQRKVLEEMALEFDCLWGGRPSISALIAAIGSKKLLIHKPGDATSKVEKKAVRDALAQIIVASDQLLKIMTD